MRVIKSGLPLRYKEMADNIDISRNTDFISSFYYKYCFRSNKL